MPDVEELEQIVEEYHHLHEEHHRMGPESSARRHSRARLDELEERFERLLLAVPDEGDRERWRARLHHGEPAPPLPSHADPLLFKGRSEAGSEVELRLRPEGDVAILVDGSPAGRFDEPVEGDLVEIDGRVYREVFDAPPAAVEALEAWVRDPSGEPPREQAPALLADGLIDRHLGLTARGRRALQRRA